MYSSSIDLLRKCWILFSVQLAWMFLCIFLIAFVGGGKSDYSQWDDLDVKGCTTSEQLNSINTLFYAILVFFVSLSIPVIIYAQCNGNKTKLSLKNSV
jgi:hypothetical protein